MSRMSMDDTLGQSPVDTSSELLLIDEFKEGFDLAETWALVRIGSFTADDGAATISPSGLQVEPHGVNPVTGEPAFTLSGAGELDHLKWMADTQRVSTNSYPGFDAVPGKVLSCTMRGKGETFGTAAHPFGDLVTDAQADLRLAAFAMNVIDYETGMVFDTWQTNARIYPYYERINVSGSATYQRFSSIFPGVPRSPEDDDEVSVAYDRSAGILRWIINGREAARVEKIGYPSPDASMLIDRGGTPQRAAPRQLNCGMALFTLMDGGSPPSGDGLADLGGSYQFPTHFVGAPTLFGQGARMEVRKFEIRSTAGGLGGGTSDQLKS
jgi:Family of unknown function (DUF6081)